MPYDNADMPEREVTAHEAQKFQAEVNARKAAHFSGQNKLAESIGGGALGNYPSAQPTRMTADAVLQQKIESLYIEINGLKALRAALPREMGFEADAAFWKLLIK